MSVEKVARYFLNSDFHEFLLKQDSLSLGSPAPPIPDLGLGPGLALQGALFSAALLWPPSPPQVAAEKVPLKSLAPWWTFSILQEGIFGCATAF